MADVVVIGAGFSGLTAALRLEQSGHRVTVLEARERVGGRVHSRQLSNGAVVEMGGEWLKVDQEHVIGLAGELGVAMADTGVDFAMRDLVGSPPIPVDEHRRVAGILTGALGEVTDEQRSTMSAAEFIDSVDDGSEAMAVVRSRIEGSSAVSLDTVGLDYLDSDYGFVDDEYVRVSDGNQALAEAIALRLEDIRFGSVAMSISVADGVVVGTGDETIQADVAVVSVPLPLITKIHFDPPLSPPLLTAIEAMQMGTAAKIAVATATAPPSICETFEQSNGLVVDGERQGRGDPSRGHRLRRHSSSHRRACARLDGRAAFHRSRGHVHRIRRDGRLGRGAMVGRLLQRPRSRPG